MKNDLSCILSHLFERWHVHLPILTNQTVPLPQDFDKGIKKLLLAADIHNRVENPLKSTMGGKTFWDGISFKHTPQNMEEIAKILEITILRTSHFYYVRDHFLYLQNRQAVIAHSSPFLEQATIRTHSSNIYLNRTAATHTANQFFNVWSGYTKSYTSRIYEEQEHFFKNPPKQLSYTYFEGGNIFILKNSKGMTKALIGADHLAQTFHLLELESRSWEELAKLVLIDKTFNQFKSEIAASLHSDQIKKTAKEMFAQDLLHPQGQSGLISHKDQLEMMLMKFFAQEMLTGPQTKEVLYNLAISKGALVPFEFREQDEATYRTVAAEYLTKLKITQGLMALDIGIPSQDVHFITQVNYHLDLFLTPGPNGCLFLNNFALCAELLETLEKAPELNLSEMDREHLERYLATARKLEQELGGLLKEVEMQLKEAGFEAIPTPGIFMYESKTMYREFPMPSGGFNINLMNAVTGRNSRTGDCYYITHGIQAGQRLGGILMEAFTLFLTHYVPEIEVYFIGRNPEDSKDFSEAMDWWNRLETQSGIHCTTFEIDH